MSTNDKYIIFMPAGEMQSSAVDYLKSIGLKIILCDGNENAFLKSRADIFLCFDIFNIDECKKSLISFEHLNIVGAFTASADCHKTIAYITDKLRSKATWNTKISDICSNKSKTREFLKDICIQPKSNLIQKFTDIQEISKFYDKSVVLKPIDSSGSRGFQSFNNVDAITIDDFKYTMNFSRSKKIILEEKIYRSEKYISEVSAEAIFWNNKLKITNIVDRLFTGDIKKYESLGLFDDLNLNEGVEIGHFNPSFIDEPVYLKIESLFWNIFKKLNSQLDLTSIKLDIMINERDEPIILEMTPRTSGGWDSCFSNIVVGGNMLKNLLNYIVDVYSAKEAFEVTYAFHEIKKRVFVLGVPENNSPNCIGRNFYPSQALNKEVSIEKFFKDSVSRYKRGEKIEPVKII